jgi:hypothetical protein
MRIAGATKEATFGLVLFGIGLILWILDREKPWGLIGACVGLGSVGIMLLKDSLAAYGVSYRDEINAEELKDKNGRKLAREAAPWMNAAGIPLLILAAFYQLMSTLAEPKFIMLNPDGTVYIEETNHKQKYIVNGQKLAAYLKTFSEEFNKLNSDVGRLWYPEFLVVNCGTEKDCECPTNYEKVKFTTKWDLNAGITGGHPGVVADKITLCMTKKPYQQSP